MAVILLSIKPEYSDRIFAGTKKYEFRRHVASETVEKIIVYSSAPVKKVIGEVAVVDVLSTRKSPLWEQTKKYAGISREKFRSYFDGASCAYAYVLGKATKYAEPIELSDFGIKNPPQSFIYLHQCPFCGNVITTGTKHNGLCTSNSEEHIIPFSLGNSEIIIPKGVICDDCNNYFAINIEKGFLAMDTISKLRSYHTISSRKGKVPDLEILFAGEKTKLEIDGKNRRCFIGLSQNTIERLKSNNISMFMTQGLDLEELKNNYTVSRFLVKIFVEINLYYALQLYGEKTAIKFDEKISELVKYIRRGDKTKKVYCYQVTLEKEPVPFSADDFIASINLKVDDKNNLSGMILKLFELKFDLDIQ